MISLITIGALNLQALPPKLGNGVSVAQWIVL
jgi:hypothetical protein